MSIAHAGSVSDPLIHPAGHPPAARIRLARGLAVAADAVQIVFVPAFGPGVVSPVNDVLDVVIAFMMIRLLGWHWGFLPSFLAELVPGLGLFPSWTVSVWIATRHRPPAELLPPPPPQNG
jgi:hypothetical protein